MALSSGSGRDALAAILRMLAGVLEIERVAYWVRSGPGHEPQLIAENATFAAPAPHLTETKEEVDQVYATGDPLFTPHRLMLPAKVADRTVGIIVAQRGRSRRPPAGAGGRLNEAMHLATLAGLSLWARGESRATIGSAGEGLRAGFLARITRYIVTADSLNEALAKVIEELAQLTGLTLITLNILDMSLGELRRVMAHNFPPEFSAQINHIRLGQAYSGIVVLSGEPIFISNVSEDQRLTHPIVRDWGMRGYACLPLPGRDRTLGTISMIGPHYHVFDEEERALLIQAGQQVGLLLELAELMHGRWSLTHLYQTAAPPQNLSPRQMQAVKLTIEGYTTKEVAHSMGISDKTLRNHLSRAYQKLHITDKAQLVLWASRWGWITGSSTRAL